MSEDVIKLLERDADFLAALQWLVLHMLAQQSSSEQARFPAQEP
jgi:hypothetical protein